METGKIPENDKNSETLPDSEPDELTTPASSEENADENAESEEIPKKGFFRKKAIILFIILIICAVVVDFFFLDDTVKMQISVFGSMLTGTYTGVQEVALSTVNLNVDAKDFSLVDPENIESSLVAADSFEFKVDPVPLLEKKVIIDTVSLQGLRWNEKRSPEEVQAQLEREKDIIPQEQEEESEDQTEESGMQLPDLEPLKQRFSEKVEISKEDLFTYNFSQRMKTDIAEMKTRHTEAVSAIQAAERIAAAQKVFDECSYLSKMKTADLLDKKKAKKAQKDIKRVDEAVKDLKKLKQEINTASGNIRKDTSAIQTEMAKLPGLKQKDMDTIKSKFSAEEFSATEIAGVIFGEKTTDMLTTYGPLFKKVSKLFPPKDKKKNLKPGKYGTTIEFSKSGDLPALLIREIAFSGEKNGIQVSGSVKGITSNSRLYGKPLTIEVASESHSFKVNAVLDRTTDTASDSYTITMSKVNAGALLPQKTSIFPFAVENGEAEILAEIHVVGGTVSYKADFVFNGIKLSGKAENVVDELIMEAVTTTPDLTFSLQKELKKPFRLVSNLDEEFTKRAKEKLSKHLAAKQKEAEALTAEIIDKEKAVLQKELDSSTSELNGQIKTYTQQIEKAREQADSAKKAFEEKKKKAEKKLKGKAEDALKGLIK